MKSNRSAVMLQGIWNHFHLNVISVFVKHSSLTGTLATNAHLPASACFFFSSYCIQLKHFGATSSATHIILHLCLHRTLIACLKGFIKEKGKEQRNHLRNILEYLRNIPNTVFSYFKITKIPNIEMYTISKIMKAIKRNETKNNYSSCFHTRVI